MLQALLLIALPGQSPLDTPKFRANLQALGSSLDPEASAWATQIKSWSNGFGTNRPDLAEWDYFHSVMVADSDPALSKAKMQEFIDSADAYMSETTGVNYTHDPTLTARTYLRCLPYLPAEQAARWKDAMEARCKRVMGWMQWGPVTRLSDDDYTVGSLFLVLSTDLALGTSYSTLNSANAVDGTDWVGCSVPEMQAAVNRWLDAAEGGEWVTQSSSYNQGTDRELVIAAKFLGTTRFPKLPTYIRSLGEYYRWQHIPTPQANEVNQFGDDQNPHETVPYYRAPLYMCIHAMGGDPDGHLLHLAKAIEPQITSAFWIAYQHAINLGFDPHSLPAVPQVVHPVGLRQLRCSVTYRTPDTMVHVWCPSYVGIDHELPSWNVRVWRKGEWHQDSVLAYMPYNRNHNGSECWGFPPAVYKEILPATEIDGGFEVELRAWQDPKMFDGYWDAPPIFIRDWRRKHRWQNGRLYTSERIEADEPTRLDRWQYGQTYYDGRIAPLAQFWHTPPGRSATPIANGFTWLTRGGVQKKLLTNAPIRSTALAEIGTNVGSTMHQSEAGGTIMQLGAAVQIDTVSGDADDAGLTVPDPVGTPPTDVKVQGVLKGKTLIIELP